MDYGSSRWRKKRMHILKKDKFICQVMKWYGLREEATIVHHIYPADEYPEYRFCDWNLISVSANGHNKLENRLTGELTDLGRWLMEKTIPGQDWRTNKERYSI